jgi:hypothetical protein
MVTIPVRTGMAPNSAVTICKLRLFMAPSLYPFGIQKLFTFRVLTLRMAPRRAVVVGIWITLVLGLVLAGYNGTSIYVWYATGNVEILGRLKDPSFGLFFFAKALFQDFFGFLIGVVLLIFAAVEVAILSKAPANKES